MQEDEADLEIGGGGAVASFGGVGVCGGCGIAFAAAGGQGKYHGKTQEQCKKLLHTIILLIYFAVSHGRIRCSRYFYHNEKADTAQHKFSIKFTEKSNTFL